jgi:hypothetical protein
MSSQVGVPAPLTGSRSPLDFRKSAALCILAPEDPTSARWLPRRSPGGCYSRGVPQSLLPVEREIEARSGAWYIRRIGNAT